MRLRDPLVILCKNPEIYDRSKVSADCFDALHSLRMLRKVDRMREAAEQGLFPEAEQLIQVQPLPLRPARLSPTVMVRSATNVDNVRSVDEF